ncbi:MAG: HprK-related kinase A [Rugosibacter sp.]|nr:MAG: HprK-related kinase A [Rugosibacter sp.]
MLRLADVSTIDFAHSLRCGTFRLQVGGFSLRIDSEVDALRTGLRQMYAHYPVSISGGYYDFDLAIRPASLLRRWFRRNVVFCLSGQAPFLPMVADHAHALFEWGLNWTIGSSVHQYLILHSAVVESRGKGVMLAAASGSGKSTLTAELAMRGWRLFSDELALIDGPALRLVPFPRPVSLKNQSIDLVRRRHPEAQFGPLAHDTQKGTIAHLRAPDVSIDRAAETAPPSLIVFPKWTAGAPLRVQPVGAGQAAMRLIDQSFNYPVLGPLGFARLADLAQSAPAWELEYSSLDDAADALDDLLADDGV